MPTEQPTLIPVPTPDSSPLALEAITVPALDPDSPGAVIAPPHPLYGGSMDSPVVEEVAHACQATGLASLRFNWRGVGASAGAASGGFEEAQQDYAAALAFMAESVSGPLVACGYSFGAAAAVAVATAHRRVTRLLLVAPPVAMLLRDRLESFAGEIWLAAGERDDYAPPSELEALASGCDRAEVVVLPEADHFLMNGLRDLGRAARDWLAKRPT